MKMSYLQLSLEVDKLYAKQFPPSVPNSVIEEHCNFIASFIEAAGWTTDEYFSEYIKHSMDDLEPQTSLKVNLASN
jgi:hypothetical protein